MLITPITPSSRNHVLKPEFSCNNKEDNVRPHRSKLVAKDIS